MSTSGCPVASACASSSRVSSTSFVGAAAATWTNFCTFHLADFREVDELVEPAAHAGDVAHVELLHAGQVRIPVGARRVPEVDVGVDHSFDRHAPLLVVRSSTMPRRVPSTHDGSSGPPKEIDASGCGWLRSPIHSAVATSSAPDSAPASSAPTRYATSSPTVDVARVGIGLDADRERVGLDVGDEVRGPRELRGRLRAASAARGRGVGHGDDAHRSTRLAGVVAHRPHPRDVAADGVGDPRVLGEHLLPRGRRRRSTPTPVRATTTASIPPASRAACPSCSAAPTKSVAGARRSRSRRT